MSDPLARLRRFLRELKRRKVYRVAITYAVVAAGAVQLVSVVIPASRLPAWSDEFFLGLAVFGFPIAVVLAWAFEVTPEGVRRTEAVEGAGSEVGAYQWIGLAVVVLLAGGVWYATAGDSGQPSGETTVAADTAQTAEASADRSASRDRPFVAVLPLENLSPDEENAFFADGIHEEILGQLSKVSGLGVFARTTMTQYENTEKSVYEIGRELDAQAVLEGSVRRAGDRVRISAQLIDPQSRDHLWSQTYERTLSTDAVFDIQADIAEQIAGALETQLASGERERIEDAPTDDLAAYEAYLRGRDDLWRFLAEFELAPLGEAIGNFRTAVRRDSAFGEAHAWLGMAYVHRAEQTNQHRWVDSAAAAVERARAIDPDLAQTHLAASFVHAARDSFSARIEALRRVLDLQPSHAVAHAELSEALKVQGRYAEGVRAAREAARLDPRRPFVLQEMGDKLRVVGLYDEAEAWDRHTLEIEPGYLHAFEGLAKTHRLRGNPEAALETWQRYEERWRRLPSGLFLNFAAVSALQADQPDKAKDYLERIPEARRQQFDEESPSRPDRLGMNPIARINLGFAELRLGHRERGQELLRSAADSLENELGRPEGPISMAAMRAHRKLNLAETLAALGQNEEALRQLEASREAVERVSVHFLTSPFFEDLRSEPRFQAIVRELEAKREAAREEIRRMGIDLYPPGAEPDTAIQDSQSDD